MRAGKAGTLTGGTLAHRSVLYKACVISAALATCLLLTEEIQAQQPSDPVRRLQVADYRAYLPEEHSVRQGLIRFSALVAAKSRGNLLVEVLKDPVPGSPAVQIDSVRQGTSGVPQMMLFAATGLASLQKEMGIFDLPYAIRDSAMVEKVVNGPLGDRLLGGIASSGLIGLAWWENGFRQVTTSIEPHRKVGNFRALRMRVVPEPVFTETFRSLGAAPKALPASRLHEALRSGEVEAQEGFDTNILLGRLYEVQQHLWLTNHSYGAIVLAINSTVWNELSDEQRQALRDAAVEAGREQRTWAREEVLRIRTLLQAHGMQVHQPSHPTLKALLAATEPVRKQFSATYSPDIRSILPIDAKSSCP